MIEFVFPLPPSLRRVVIPVFEEMLEDLGNQEGLDESRYAPPPDDPDLRETWLEDLREDQGADLTAVFRLVMHESYGTEDPVSLEPDEAEAALRGLSAIRLRIRGKHLAELSDSAIEQADFELADLLAREQRGYFAYTVAAATQDSIVRLIAS